MIKLSYKIFFLFILTNLVYFNLIFNPLNAKGELIENSKISTIHIDDKEPIKVHDVYSLPILLAAIIGVFIAIIVILIEPRIRNKDIIDYSCEALLESLKGIKPAFENTADSFRREVIDENEKIIGSYANMYIDTNPLNIIFNTSFSLFCPQTQNKLAYLHDLLNFNADLLNRISNVKDLDYLFNYNLNKKGNNTNPQYNHRIFIYEKRLIEIQNDIIQICDLVKIIIESEQKSSFKKFFRKSKCDEIKQIVEDYEKKKNSL